MEVSVVGRQASGHLLEFFPIRSLAPAKIPALPRVFSASTPRRGRVGLGVAVAGGGMVGKAPTAPIRAELVEKKAPDARRRRSVRRPQLFVGLPLDVISDGNNLNHDKAILAGLKALKLLGADGVELPIWWGVVEKEAMGKYNWSGYLELVQMIRDEGLCIRASLYFHASTAPTIPLPSWVSSIGDADPDIYFTDKEGRRHKECLSLSVDNLPVLGGETPIQVYNGFFQSFQTAFEDFIGSTIMDISIGLGPGGELRYPSLQCARNQQVAGVGEFQCYDKHMLSHLKQDAEQFGNNYWGLSGPHDAHQYDESPNTGNFFKEDGGSWESDYGKFFLTWYSDQLLSHGDRLLSAASALFGEYPVTLSGKVPLMHLWYKTRSHPTELTAGFYNTDRREGYDAVAEMFARNSCTMILPGMDLSDENHPQASPSSPELLLSQIMGACKKHGVRISGENSSLSVVANGFSKIKENIFGGKSLPGNTLVDSFTYQRMGAYFFSPEHWPQFTEFIRNIDRPELNSNDLPSEEDESLSLQSDKAPGNSREMQAV